MKHASDADLGIKVRTGGAGAVVALFCKSGGNPRLRHAAGPTCSCNIRGDEEGMLAALGMHLWSSPLRVRLAAF